MRKTLKWLAGIILLVGIAAGAYFWATGMIDSNFAYRSQIKDTPPAPGEMLGEASSSRLVFVLIDALRYDTSLKSDVMPTLNQLRLQGASALMHSQPPSFSEPGYTTLLTGAWPEINDGPVFNLDYEEIPSFTQDNLFSAAHRAGFKTAVSGYYWFEKLIPQSVVDLRFYTAGEDAAADREVVDAALPWLKNNEAQLVLIHIDQVDYAGHHEGGPQSPNWDTAAKRADDLLAEILATLDLQRDTIVVLSDHGQIDAGGHGGQDPVALLEPFVIAGEGVNPGEYADIQMVDVAPTLAALLGTNIPASAQGSVQREMLSLSESVRAALPIAVQSQQTALLTAYMDALDINKSKFEIPDSSTVSDYQNIINSLRNKRVFSERIGRAIPVALLLAMVITLLIRQRKSGSLSGVVGGLVFAFLFDLRYAFIDKKAYSLSSITSQMDLILYVGVTSAVLLIFIWLVTSITQKTFCLTPGEAGIKTLSLGLSIVFIISLPVWLSFYLNGAVVTWTLPDYFTSYMALIGLIQVLIVSGVTPILAGLTALVSRIRHKSI
ncbi:MAG: type I phosphodiesterase/nucleotide pyrophosphatase [Chloroflexi bacterium]|nr:MAG: type I phosphodiesterase/nucleotide pyrophosphatase [Chloroflexota bacterium]